jgi:hypothetical protein
MSVAIDTLLYSSDRNCPFHVLRVVNPSSPEQKHASRGTEWVVSGAAVDVK